MRQGREESRREPFQCFGKLSASKAVSFQRAGERGLRPYLLVDVFTDAPLEGNPLAVVTDAREMAAAQMQRLARELNLSETIFVLPARGDGDVRVRIFTPAAISMERASATACSCSRSWRWLLTTPATPPKGARRPWPRV